MLSEDVDINIQVEANKPDARRAEAGASAGQELSRSAP